MENCALNYRTWNYFIGSYAKPKWLKTIDFLQWNFWHYDIIVISMN